MSIPEPPAPTPSATTCTLTPGCAFAPGHTGKCFGRFRPVSPASAPAQCSHGFELASWACPGPTATREEHKAASAPAATAGNTNSVSIGSSLGVPAPTGEAAETADLLAKLRNRMSPISHAECRRVADLLTAQATELAALRTRYREACEAIARKHNNPECACVFCEDLRAALAPRQPDTTERP